MNLADLLTRQAQLRPHALAIMHGDRRLSYADLESLVWGLCRNFRDSGLCDGDVVGLHLHDPLLLMAVVIALARSGVVNVTLPTDPGTAAIQENLLSRTVASVVVEDSNCRDWRSWSRIYLDPEVALETRGDRDDRLRVERPVALLMYSNSSGTTGSPKVFGVTHEAAVASLLSEVDSIGYPEGERYLSGVLPTYAAPRRRYLCCLAAGGTAVMPPSVEGVAGLVDAIDRLDIRHFSCVPAQAYEMAMAVPVGSRPRFPRMRCLRLSAGPSDSTLHEVLRERLTPNIVVSYGCNELGPLTVAPSKLLEQRPNTVGRPIKGVSVEVVDADDRALQPDSVGQIRLRAPGMPQGYLNEELATAKSFRNGWFYPGDLGQWTEDGLLRHMGRSDDMMIMNGINIYPAEIEQAMMSHSAVRDAKALPLKHPVAGDEPVCAVVLKEGVQVSARELMVFALGKLGSHCPNRIEVLEAIPRNDLGKVQRAVLMELIMSRSGFTRQPSQSPDIRTREDILVEAPLGQLSLTAAVTFRLPSNPDLEKLDAWLDGGLQLGVSDLSNSEGSLQRDQVRLALAWLRRALLLCRMLLQAARIPVFDLPRVITCRHEHGREETWLARVAFARIEELPNPTYGLALKVALDLNEWAMTRPVNAQSLQSFYALVDQGAASRLRPEWLTGGSTLPILRAAHRMSIPFSHLGAGVFQLGWGCKAQRMQRSVTEGDSAIGANLCNDKATTATLLRKAGLPAPVHIIVNDLQSALNAARQIGWPVVVKPVDRERGEGVVVDVASDSQLRTAFESAYAMSSSKKVIIERQVDGVCHRLFVALGRLLYAVKRLPMSVEGDGLTDIAGLVDLEVARQLRLPRQERSGIRPLDDLAREAISRAGYTLTSVPTKGSRVPLRRIESTEWGGVDEDVGGKIHPENLRIALAGSALFGLDVVGIDIITTDIARPWYENGAIINEVNFAPLLGGGEISRRHIPAFLDALIEGRGMIPVEVFVGGETAWTAATGRWQELIKSGGKAFLSHDRCTMTPWGEEWHMPFTGLYRRARALVLSPDVEAIVLVVQTDEFLTTGLPLEAVGAIRFVDEDLNSALSKAEALSRERIQLLLQLLQGWRKEGSAG